MSFGSLVRTAYCGAGFGTIRTTRDPKLVEKKAGACGGKLVNSSGGTYPGTAGSGIKPLIDGLCGTKAYKVRKKKLGLVTENGIHSSCRSDRSARVANVEAEAEFICIER